jgi:hypothetical protein
VRLTPSTRHITATGKFVFSAAMNEYASPTAVVLPREEDRGFSQDLPLHPQLGVLVPQPIELVALIAAQPAWTLAPRGLLRLEPMPERDVRDPEILRQLALRLIAEPG